MKALWFLTTRRFINSFKRAFQNPGRTVGTMVIIAFILLVYIAPLFTSGQGPAKPSQLAKVLPPLQIISSALTLLIGGYLAFTFIAATNYSRAFNEHDVSNVFPTPLPRTLVFQFFVFVKGVLGGIFGIVFIAYLFFRTGRTLMLSISNAADPGSGVLGSGVFALLFIVADGACLLTGIICGMYMFRKKISKMMFWGTAILLFASFSSALIFQSVSNAGPDISFLGSLLRQASEPPFNWILLPVRGIGDSALVMFNGWTLGIFGAVVLWGILALWSKHALLESAPWMYEYAVLLSLKNAKRREQLKNRSFSMKAWTQPRKEQGISAAKGAGLFGTWVPTGAKAVFWRNTVMMQRSSLLLTIKIIIFFIVFFSVGIAALHAWKPGIDDTGLTVLSGTIQYMVLMIFMTTSISWLTETLKRFELQKPLPLQPRLVILAELMPIGIVVAGCSLLGIAGMILLFPARTGIFLLAYIALVSSFFIIGCLIFIVLLFNPDHNDNLQRMLFGIYNMFVLGIGLLPAGAVIAVGVFLHLHLIVQGILLLSVNGACMYLLLIVAAKKYESFNPVD